MWLAVWSLTRFFGVSSCVRGSAATMLGEWDYPGIVVLLAAGIGFFSGLIAGYRIGLRR